MTAAFIFLFSLVALPPTSWADCPIYEEKLTIPPGCCMLKLSYSHARLHELSPSCATLRGAANVKNALRPNLLQRACLIARGGGRTASCTCQRSTYGIYGLGCLTAVTCKRSGAAETIETPAIGTRTRDWKSRPRARLRRRAH